MKIKNTEDLIKDNLIVKHLAGSHSYGTNIETSDIDYRGIFVANPVNIRTPFFSIKEAKDYSEEDTVIYELNQFMKLAVDCNPNVLETLHVDEKHITFTSPAYELLRSYAPKLLCSKIAFTTTGYATSQLHRIKGHNKWLVNPQPKSPPVQTTYVSNFYSFTYKKLLKFDIRDYYENHRLIPYIGDTYGLYQCDGYTPFNIDTGNLNTTYNGNIHDINGIPLFVVKFNRDEFQTDFNKWNQYWDWKLNRNPTRSKMEDDFGFDCKHAMHLVRLLRIGEEVLTTGKYNVLRSDADELLDIRNGKWTYNELLEYAEEKNRYIKDVLYHKTDLPKYPDYELASNLLMEVQDIVWSNK